MAYDEKFRRRVIQYKDSGHTFAEVHEAFGVRPQCYYEWKAELEEKGECGTHYPKSHKGKIDPERLKDLAEKHPDWYLREFAAELGVCLQAIAQRFEALGITRKKKTFTYSEKSEVKREEFLREVERIPEEDRVYVDESGIKDDLKREYGRAPRGVMVGDSKRGRKFHRVNVVAGETHGADGVRHLSPLCYQGTMNGVRFEEWFENGLLKTTGKGKTIIMDRASFHRKTKLEEIREKNEVSLLYLPPYSPDFNPIEKTWANMKKDLRNTAPLHELIESAIYDYLS